MSGKHLALRPGSEQEECASLLLGQLFSQLVFENHEHN